MSANEIPDFAADFAERVLEKADRMVARRRQAAAGAASASVLLLVVISWIAMRPNEVVPPSAAPKPVVEAATEGDRTEALSYLFPDATPVARFAASDSGDEADFESDRDALDPLDDGSS